MTAQQRRLPQRVQILPLGGDRFALAHADLDMLGAALRQVRAECRQRGELVVTSGSVVPVGDGRLVIHVRRVPAPQMRALPAAEPAWVRKHWRPVAVGAAVVVLAGSLGVWWLVAHLDEIIAAVVAALLTLAGFVALGLIPWLLIGSVRGGSGHCPGPWHR